MTIKKTAFVFPGQGSQHVGMMNNFINNYPIVQKTFREASDILGYDLWKLVQEDPYNQLNQTKFTQPSLLTAGVAIWRAWNDAQGFTPDYLAGHSLGEYTALVCAEALSFKDALILVSVRGELMQNAVTDGTGTMAAILGLSKEQIQNICTQINNSKYELEKEKEQIVQIANLNSPLQTVIAGHKNAVEKAIEQAEKLGAQRVIILPVSVPAHCELMRTAAIKFQQHIAKIKWHQPRLPVINNVNVAIYNDINIICETLVTQLYSPVRWVETIEYLIKLGVKQIFECGPGKVLTGLNKRIDKNLILSSLSEAKFIASIA